VFTGGYGEGDGAVTVIAFTLALFEFT
jgi:hypothetical protein